MASDSKSALLDSDKPLRISIYVYPAQLRIINEICSRRNKTKRRIFLEAIQSYIALYEQGEI